VEGVGLLRMIGAVSVATCLLAGCVAPPAPSAPPQGVNLSAYGRLLVLEVISSARAACQAAGGGATTECFKREYQQRSLVAESTAFYPTVTTPATQAAEEGKAKAAFQLAAADCRDRGISRENRVTWDACWMDRGTIRLREVLGL
jgi:hypothetical protein